MIERDDKLIISCIRYLVLHRNVSSPSYIQRKLQIGYNRAYLYFHEIHVNNGNQIKFKHRRFISKYKKTKEFT